MMHISGQTLSLGSDGSYERGRYMLSDILFGFETKKYNFYKFVFLSTKPGTNYHEWYSDIAEGNANYHRSFGSKKIANANHSRKCCNVSDHLGF